MYMPMPTEARRERWNPTGIITGSPGQPVVSAGNQIPVFCKKSKHSQPLSHFSSTL